jgi:SAM-dependent methyltransferase
MATSDDLENKRRRLSPEKLQLLKRRLGADFVRSEFVAPRNGELAAATRSWRDPASLDLSSAPLIAAGERAAAVVPVQLRDLGFRRLDPALNQVAVASMAAAIRHMGVFCNAGERFSVSSLVQVKELLPANRKLVAAFFVSLAQHGWLEQEQDGVFSCSQPLVVPSAQTALQSALQCSKDTNYAAIVERVAANANELHAILTGASSAAEALFEGGAPVLETAYGGVAEAQYSEGILAALAEALSTSAERPLRVLEIGAGLGATTRRLSPLLTASGGSYVFTDVSKYFIQRAQTRFHDTSGMFYGLLNIDEAPMAAGEVEGKFDLVVASNVLHCSRFLARSLTHARALLKPGGVFLLLEATRNEAWHQISMGLLKGFMSFEDERLIQGVPFVGRQIWESLLSNAGFADITTFPANAEHGELVGQHVFLARK